MFHGSRRSDCKIATDDFNRANSDNPGAKWFEDGDADIDNNELLIPVGASATLKFLTAHPGGATANQRAKVKFKLPVAGSADGSPKAAIVVGYADANNYLFVTVEGATAIGEKTAIDLRLRKRHASAESDVQDLQRIIIEAADNDAWHTLEVCYEPDLVYSYYSPGGMLRAKVTMASGTVWGSQARGDFSFTGAYVGLKGTAGDTQGVIRFDDFYFGSMSDADAACKAQCPNCNTPCFIVSDAFGYDWGADTDYGPLWQEISGGGWERISNELKLNSSGPGIIICKTFHPQIKTHHHVTCDVYIASGLKPRILVNGKSNASSFHWAELEWNGTSTLTLRIGKGGFTLDTATTAFSAAGFITLTVCYDGNGLTATAGTATASSQSFAVVDGIYVGVAGNSSGGGERFDNFVFQKHRSFTDPPDANCPNCEEESDCDSEACDGEDNVPPGELGIDLGALNLTTDTACNNFTGNEWDCSPCAQFGGLYVVNAAPNPIPAREGCYWQYRATFLDVCFLTAGGDSDTLRGWTEFISLELFDNGDGTHTWFVIVNICLASQTHDTNANPCNDGQLGFCRTIYYSSGPLANGPCIENLPLPLSLVEDSTTPDPYPGVVCDGPIPSTIFLRMVS